jgi:hypothetical protein
LFTDVGAPKPTSRRDRAWNAIRRDSPGTIARRRGLCHRFGATPIAHIDRDGRPALIQALARGQDHEPRPSRSRPREIQQSNRWRARPAGVILRTHDHFDRWPDSTSPTTRSSSARRWEPSAADVKPYPRDRDADVDLQIEQRSTSGSSARTLGTRAAASSRRAHPAPPRNSPPASFRNYSSSF